jgi:hypothetical protein
MVAMPSQQPASTWKKTSAGGVNDCVEVASHALGLSSVRRLISSVRGSFLDFDYDRGASRFSVSVTRRVSTGEADDV